MSYSYLSGSRTHFSEVIDRSRCVLVVLNESFLLDINCLFDLTNVVPEIDVIYVVHDLDLEQIDRALLTLRLGHSVLANVENIRDAGKLVVWPKKVAYTSFAADRHRWIPECTSGARQTVDEFWRRLRLAVPSNHGGRSQKRNTFLFKEMITI